MVGELCLGKRPSVITGVNSGLDLVFRKKLVIDYDQKVLSIALPKEVRYVSDDMEGVETSRHGKAEATIVLLKKPRSLVHYELKRIMQASSVEQAGVHETFGFAANFLSEFDFDQDMQIISMLEEIRTGGNEFIPTILGRISGHNQKKSYEIKNLTLWDLSFPNTYVLGIEEIVPIF